MRLSCQETELGQTFGTSVVTNYIQPACMAWEEGYNKVGSLALMWQEGIYKILSTVCLVYEILICGILASSCV